MKTRVALYIASLLLANAAIASEKKAVDRSVVTGAESFEKLKTLVGVWKGSSPHGPLTVSYRLTSNSSVIVETMDTSHGEMLTVYHLDKGHLVLTHYCSAGNQPHMKTPGLAGDTLRFTEVSVSNLADAKAMHMSGVTFQFKDADHFAQEWTTKENGKEQKMLFEYTRA